MYTSFVMQTLIFFVGCLPFLQGSQVYMIGSQVWVEDPVEAWIDGEVVEINGDEITINTSSGKTVGSFIQYFFSLVIGHIMVYQLYRFKI